MCMLSFFPGGVLPVPAEILNGVESNPDGSGFAIVTKDYKLMIRKDMNGEALAFDFLKARRDNPDGPAIFHSRIATSGLVDITGCHPFKVGGDNTTVLAHNGILFRTDSERSDTRVFAEDILPNMGNLNRSKTTRRVETFIGRGNKIAVLTVNPRYRDTSYLYNETAGIWAESGAWHSNYDYEGRWWGEDDNYLAYGTNKAGRPVAKKPASIRYGMSVFACEVCGAYDAVSMADGICEVCNSCNDCKQHVLSCMCYTPASAHREGSSGGREIVQSGNGYWEKTPSGGWAYNS